MRGFRKTFLGGFTSTSPNPKNPYASSEGGGRPEYSHSISVLCVFFSSIDTSFEPDISQPQSPSSPETPAAPTTPAADTPTHASPVTRTQRQREHSESSQALPAWEEATNLPACRTTRASRSEELSNMLFALNTMEGTYIKPNRRVGLN